MIKPILKLVYLSVTSVEASIRQRICTDAELALLSLQQSIQGSDLNTCIQIDPQTKLVTPISMKTCLMSAGATELCASCFAAINEAFSQCAVKCDTYGSQSTDCKNCLKTIQVSYELTDDQMATWQLYDICRTGFANERGEILTTGAPQTTTLPPVMIDHTATNGVMSSSGSRFAISLSDPIHIILIISVIISWT